MILYARIHNSLELIESLASVNSSKYIMTRIKRAQSSTPSSNSSLRDEVKELGHDDPTVSGYVLLISYSKVPADAQAVYLGQSIKNSTKKWTTQRGYKHPPSVLAIVFIYIYLHLPHLLLIRPFPLPPRYLSYQVLLSIRTCRFN